MVNGEFCPFWLFAGVECGAVMEVPEASNSGLEAALGQLSNILVLRGKWSLPLWPVSLRLWRRMGLVGVRAGGT